MENKISSNDASFTDCVQSQDNKSKTIWFVLGVVAIIIVIVAVVLQNNATKKENSLVGEWLLGNNSSLIFFENGSALWKRDVGTRSFEWSVSENTMILYISGTSCSYNWAIIDNVLYLDGQYYATRGS